MSAEEVLGSLAVGCLVVLLGGPGAPTVRARESTGWGPGRFGPSVAAAGRGRFPAVAAVVGLAVLAVATIGPVLAAIAAVTVPVARHLGRRARSRQQARAVELALPELVDLLQLAVGSGLPVIAALAAIVPRAPPPVADPLATALLRVERGIALDEVLTDLGAALGPTGDALLAALARSAATGAPLGPLLGPVAADGHERRRRQAQEAAHRLPVTLLLPLAGCILPAAIVLAIVPVVAVALGDLAP